MSSATRAAFYGCLAALAGVVALAILAWPGVKRELVAGVAAELEDQGVGKAAGRDAVTGAVAELRGLFK